ncbi:zinc finger protein 142 isoform X2 [Thalassophryne amazonica]|uniref:zinc finger protein 142 isoform X2 n=1 Tax=Thalassophryne amazonica TaxID=390379 RepID=UPI001471FC09|nr:zinc finger protein 142 isoform X2 [Thalassophryne amazonica]
MAASVSKQKLMNYKCSLCSDAFSKPAALKRHFKLLHMGELEPKGNELLQADVSTDGIKQPLISSRPKRQRSNMAHVASSPEKGTEDKPEMQKNNMTNTKRSKKKGKSSALVSQGLSSKAYLAEGTEHIYHTHICPVCRRCFKMRSHLQEHLHLHFPDPSLQCPTCKRYFTSKSKLRLHKLRETGEKLHHCHLCEYSAVERAAIRRHLVSVHADDAEGGKTSDSYSCPTCGQGFGQSRSLKAHMKTHNVLPSSKPVGCFQEGCSFQTTLHKALLKHTFEAHGIKAVECRHHACGAIFQSEEDMEAHHRTHLAYHCSLCDFSCCNKTVFLQHRRHGHLGTNKLCCKFCSFVTFNPVEFEQHIGHLHANEKIHRCLQCSYVTSHKRGLKRHMLMHSGEKPHKCSLCDFRCRDESYLSKHMLIHSEDKNFMCSECGYVTKWKHYLNVHMRKHAGDLRYHCDQCPYRCHRMDQLKSHKLRHQAKSLMCEICAYACKRKYELRNHMLAKHAAEGEQPCVYKCRYCLYTTCYRQALQNHENCKHTKLKEFRCALCFYSSFSSISLFLHKRKAHGYVPGDKAWLENYAAKEREKNSNNFMQDFYKKPEQPDVPPSPAADNRRGATPPSGGQSFCTEAPADSQTVGSENVFEVLQEVATESISNCSQSVNSPEEYCTLVLTTLSTADYQMSCQQNEEDNNTSPTPLTPTIALKESDTPHDKTSQSSCEEADAAVAGSSCDQSDFDDNYEPLNNTSQKDKVVTCQTRIPEVENVGIISCSVSSEHNFLESETHLKAMKKHDRDQAETMVLEGRVQLLVVPIKDAYSCDKCSYVTCKETTLTHHCQSSCCSRVKGHKCQACGMQLTQRRGLESHRAKKCPVVLRKIGTLETADNCSMNQFGSRQLDKGINSDQPQSLLSQSRIVTDSQEQEFNQPEEVPSSCLTNYTGSDDSVTGLSDSRHQQKNIQKNDELNVKLSKKRLFLHKKRRTLSQRKKVVCMKKDGKFKCKLCSFSAANLPTLGRHFSTCRKSLRKKENCSFSQVDYERVNALSRDETRENMAVEYSEHFGEVPKKHQDLSCSNCAFKCSQKRALDHQEKRGWLRQEELKCSFVAKAKTSLTHHVQYAHNKSMSDQAKSQRLHCEHCTFTCKQEQRMAQHVARKHSGSRPHQCTYCPFNTARRYRLEEHNSLHTGIGRQSCVMCSKTFGTAAKLHQHKTRVHDKQPTHFCSLCDFSGYTLADVRRHSLRCHTGELLHACTHCKALFSSDVALRNHCKRVHQFQVRFSCMQCDYTCSTEDALKAHQQDKHPPLTCTTCQETCKTKEGLEIHQRTHLAYQCHSCTFAAKTRQALAKHLLNKHEDGSPDVKPLKCSSCQFACRHHLVLEQHLRSHGGKRLYRCIECKYSTRNKQKIIWHIRKHTGEKPYRCHQCTYSCADPARLKLHMRVHREEKKYLCPDCGYKCKWATQLKYHMTKHTGEKPYACDDCNYRTNRADALRAHRDTQHCDVRSFICEKCGKAFKTSFILKTHQRQHSDGRPYTCGSCHKAFRWPAGLRHHYLSHTKQQPFCCRHCSYRAKQKFQVVKHLQRHHPEMSVEQGVVKDSETASLTLKEALEGRVEETAAEEQEDTGTERQGRREEKERKH